MIDARALLRQANLTPKKSFGQNFLVSERVVRAIAEACVTNEEHDRARVIELGAGLGALTSELLLRARRVVAVERDRDLVPILARTFADEQASGRLEILEADAQTIDVRAILGDADPSSLRVLAGNLPYQITGRLLQLAVMNAENIERVVFMTQEEVADRLLAAPGSKTYGALTVFVRAAFDVSRVMVVGRGCFHPEPDVTSAVVRLVPRRPPRARETDAFRAVVKGAFATRRKTLRNAWKKLASPEDLARAASDARISLDARGETLDVEAFAAMTRALESVGAFSKIEIDRPA